MENLRLRWLVVVLVVAMGLFWLLPNFVKQQEGAEGSLLGQKKLVMGLDIQGGLHIVMGVDIESVIKEQTSRMLKNLSADMKDRGIQNAGVKLAGDSDRNIEISYSSEADKTKIESYINDYYGTQLQILGDADGKMNLRFFDAYMIESRKQIVNQSIEVIRNRIDEFGVSEPSITAQGDDRILVQLPGIKDAQRAKDLINRAAVLNFRVVSDKLGPEELIAMISEVEKAGGYNLNPKEENGGLSYSAYVKRINADLKAKLPPKTLIAFEKLENAKTLEAGRRPYLLDSETKLTGGQLEDASVGQDEYGKPQVNFRFSVQGRKLFADLTEKAAGGFMAIVLDDVVKSAPSVKARIDSDSARITLGSSGYNEAFEEAQGISIALRAGALPAALEQLEERTVGPTLGADAIAKGQKGTLIGAAIVLVFILLYYGVLGIIASVSIILNLMFVFGALTSLGATLTLPGVAGLALTVGMAVDANIIIYERIREELRKGSSQLAAMRDGFGHALSAILDANITTLLTCFILMYYGTGPVRGFAVTLTIGIIASMFTSIFVARTLAETFVQKLNLKLMKTKVVA